MDRRPSDDSSQTATLYPSRAHIVAVCPCFWRGRADDYSLLLASLRRLRSRHSGMVVPVSVWFLCYPAYCAGISNPPSIFQAESNCPSVHSGHQRFSGMGLTARLYPPSLAPILRVSGSGRASRVRSLLCVSSSTPPCHYQKSYSGRLSPPLSPVLSKVFARGSCPGRSGRVSASSESRGADL